MHNTWDLNIPIRRRKCRDISRSSRGGRNAIGRKSAFRAAGFVSRGYLAGMEHRLNNMETLRSFAFEEEIPD